MRFIRARRYFSHAAIDAVVILSLLLQLLAFVCFCPITHVVASLRKHNVYFGFILFFCFKLHAFVGAFSLTTNVCYYFLLHAIATSDDDKLVVALLRVANLVAVCKNFMNIGIGGIEKSFNTIFYFKPSQLSPCYSMYGVCSR